MVVAAVEPLERVILTSISWTTYEAILKDMGDRPIRLTYDRGVLQIMSPSKKHDRFACLIDRMIGTLTEELGIPIQSVGSTTWRDAFKERGLEADESYYIQNEPLVRGSLDFDPDTHPFPDLAVEIEVTRSVLDRLAIYATLGIGEVWRCDGQSVVALGLEGGSYQAIEMSRAIPCLRVGDLEPWLASATEIDETTWIRRFRRWVRETFLPQ